jgi:Uncharacterized conserved protein (COG2071)
MAYVGLVAFRMRCYGEFLEFNVRTYSVDNRGRRGVVFLTMEADRFPWVLAARAARLPYRWSRMGLTRDLHEIDYRSVRRWPGPIGTGTHLRLRVGPPIAGNPVAHFLTARWRLHHHLNATTVTVQLTHDAWPLHAACSASTTTSLRPPVWPRPSDHPPASSTPRASAVAWAYRPRVEPDPRRSDRPRTRLPSGGARHRGQPADAEQIKASQHALRITARSDHARNGAVLCRSAAGSTRRRPPRAERSSPASRPGG